MDFHRADFGLFRMLVESVPWERVLKGKGVQAEHQRDKKITTRILEKKKVQNAIFSPPNAQLTA